MLKLTPKQLQFRPRHWHKASDYSFHKTFGQAAPSEIPALLNMVTRILDQGGLNACTAFAAVAIREWMKKPAQYDPVQQWNNECAVWGNPAQANQTGVDLNTQMATGVEKGFVPVGTTTPTDNAAAYFSVTPTKSIFNPSGLDMYDSIKSAMSLQNSPLSAGLTWMQEWVSAPNGIIVDNSGKTVLGAHDIKIAGWLTMSDGVERLIIQNSWGIDEGQNGLYYFDRATANQAFTQGTKFWTDSTVSNYKTLGFIQALCQNVIDLLTQELPGFSRALGFI
jgi:hypothetical protein